MELIAITAVVEPKQSSAEKFGLKTCLMALRDPIRSPGICLSVKRFLCSWIGLITGCLDLKSLLLSSMNKKSSSSRAFVLLYSLLVASIVLAIGMSLATIISKQIILSSIGKMSRVAYYAADAGRDCAFFWAVKYGSTASETINPTVFDPRIYCQGTTLLQTASKRTPPEPDEKDLNLKLLEMYGIDDLLISPNDGYQYFDFKQDITGIEGGSPACNKFSVLIYSEDSLSIYSAIIVSRGFSAPCSATGPRTVGRSVINVVKR